MARAKGTTGKGKLREASIEIKVIRADGTVEDHGTVSYWHKNPLRRWAWQLQQRRRRKHGN